MLIPPHVHLSHFTAVTSVASSNFGQAVSSGANAYAAWTQIHTGLDFASDYVIVVASNHYTSAVIRNGYVDIGIGPSSGAVMPIVEKLCASHAAPGFGRSYFLPLRIPPDTPIWARTQSSAGVSIAVQLSAFCGNMNPGTFPSVRQIVALGANAASSIGTSITPGSSGTEGGWTEIVASTTEDYAGLMVSGLFNVDSSQTANLLTTMDIGIGASGQERTIGENVCLNMPSGTDERVVSVSYPVFAGIPVGSRLCIRASASASPDSAGSAILLAFKH